MAKVIFVVIYAFGFQTVTAQIDLGSALANIIENRQNENVTLQRIPQIDVIGNLINVLDRMLTQATKGRPPPKSSACNTHLMRLGQFELKLSQQPRGYCTYCCRLYKPAKYVGLFFSNKIINQNSIQLKMSKKSGAFRSAGVDSNSPTVIFIHGFSEYGLGPAPRIIRDAYLSLDQNYNIILVDWGDLTPMPWYPQSAQNTKLVAATLAKFIKFYNDTGELPISNLHLVGFSLGAHIAGFVGKYFQDQKIPRITGLDPAFPMFPINDPAQRLSKDDAEFVDVIHTAAGLFGYPVSLGHADFYPNGGTFMQPGCETSSLAKNQRIEQFGACDHLRAWNYYAESVRNPSAFPATTCGIMKEGSFKECRFRTEGYMGFLANNSMHGDFYLTTNNQRPFGKSAIDQEADMKVVNLIL